MTISHETGLKKKQRGWYIDPAPGLKDLRGKFEDAERSAGNTKLAAHERAVLDVLGKFALFQDSPDPIKSFVEVLQTRNFGYGADPGGPPQKGRDLKFGPDAPMNSGFGDQLGNNYDQFGGV